MQKEEDTITYLGLQPHPEGGYYRETYRSSSKIPVNDLPEGFSGSRNTSTGIYYLLLAGSFSAFHKIRSDEMWHFYDGLPLHVYVMMPDGSLTVLKLGRNSRNGETYQAVVPAGCWFASKPAGEDGYSLVGCTVAPGFDFADFTMAERQELIQQYPQHKELVMQLTR